MPCDDLPWAGIRLLRDRQVRPGERWIYSAGFNVRPDLRARARVDEELADLGRLLECGARVAILSHQGSLADGSAGSLEFVADYLSARLDAPVDYFPQNDTPAAAIRARALEPGTAAIFGNTRMHEGETRDDPRLARRFAELGDIVAIGGFSKAHRGHASNVGILRHRRGYLADSVLRQLLALTPWAGASPRYSVAVVGGLKREKSTLGLQALAETYDVVVPGGAVLNNVLRALGHDVGSSALGEDPDGCLAVARQVLSHRRRAQTHIPDRVVTARVAPGPPNPRESKVIDVRAGVPQGWAIVDFVPQPWLHDRLDQLRRGGRALLAGTPCRYLDGFTASADAILAAFGSAAADALLLGGDTVAELPWKGRASTGGGSALYFLAHGGCPILDALRDQDPPGDPRTGDR